MHLSIFVCLLFCSVTINAHNLYPRSTLNGPCTQGNGQDGVCIAKSSCNDDGGNWVDNACPGLPENIKCCTKATCQKASRSGDCRWSKNCGAGHDTLPDLCPGPSTFKCCVPKEDQAKSKPEPKQNSNLGEQILQKAMEAKGVDYVGGGGDCKGPTNGGYDCSGLLRMAICKVTGRDIADDGIRKTRFMYCASESDLKYKKVKFADRRRGDAVFFGNDCDCKLEKSIHHVGLMMDSKYTMWHAPRSGRKVGKESFKDWPEQACPTVIRFE